MGQLGLSSGLGPQPLLDFVTGGVDVLDYMVWVPEAEHKSGGRMRLMDFLRNPASVTNGRIWLRGVEAQCRFST